MNLVKNRDDETCRRTEERKNPGENGNLNSSSVDHRFTSASRAFTQKKLDDLKSLFVSLASKSHSNDQYVSYPVFQVLTICVSDLESFLDIKSCICYMKIVIKILAFRSKILNFDQQVPSANAIFFHGDKVQDTGNHVIERLYDLQKVAEIIVSKFGNSVNAWVVEASVFNGPFAIYKDFVPSVNHMGAPKSYSPVGFPASSSIVSLLSSCLHEVLKEGTDVCLIDQIASVHHCPKTIVLGFSKGGVVMNQLMSEISSLDTNFAKTSSAMVEESTSQHEKIQIIPASKESFLNSISEVHYIDVGLNSSGAYITDHNVVQRISQRLARGADSLRIVIHGTPRQWCDELRGWIRKEKDELVRLLKAETENSGGKLQVCERFYFSDRLADLQMHFEIIDAMDVS
ncbi:hypothetical protein AT2G44850 [Arabidopsis thaliana]|uniref:Uncharacterized protein At2g44850 n=1 Tax=Arabidopsis thaliana TaxID=3702 RepID=O22166_ARATH|nr:uncharacterized protein AT2G44850 [Arabidopsis thaliana]AAC31839.1 unknown protein [Arabidopsis thaliana]AEC10474.1 hypothetical protein AT2G44850 [Arabidopsis thaliana]|eukprot:NP_182012.1 hypothetical protein AT2G44850 [Arabidopsis thaliana]